MITIGMLVLLLIDTSIQLDAKHFVDQLTREDWLLLDRLENPGLYERF